MENFGSLLIPLLILVLFVPIFLQSRKQRRQVAEMQALQAALEAGDVVITTSGLRATVVDATYDETVDLEIADGIVTTWVRAAVREKVAVDDADETPPGEILSDDALVDEPGPVLSLDKDDSTNGTSRS